MGYNCNKDNYIIILYLLICAYFNLQNLQGGKILWQVSKVQKQKQI